VASGFQFQFQTWDMEWSSMWLSGISPVAYPTPRAEGAELEGQRAEIQSKGARTRRWELGEEPIPEGGQSTIRHMRYLD